MPAYDKGFITEQASDPYCRKVATTDGSLGSDHSYDMNGVLIRHFRMNGSLQHLISTLRPARILYFAHGPVLVGYPSKQLHDTLQHEYYWTQIINDTYTDVANCQSFIA